MIPPSSVCLLSPLFSVSSLSFPLSCLLSFLSLFPLFSLPSSLFSLSLLFPVFSLLSLLSSFFFLSSFYLSDCCPVYPFLSIFMIGSVVGAVKSSALTLVISAPSTPLPFCSIECEALRRSKTDPFLNNTNGCCRLLDATSGVIARRGASTGQLAL